MGTPTFDYPRHPRKVLAYDDDSYPDSLRDLADPPKRLFLIGNSDLLHKPAIAIVGSRKASAYGLICAQRFSRQAAFRDLVVVSGGAVGCDQAAHEGALAVDGLSIVVLGCGADVIYPSNARDLLERVLAAGGLIVSELPWGAPPARWAFVQRNRVIAGLSQATLIVEAGLPSGTFSTADATLGLGRELLVLPGSILSKQSAGSNRLIAQGAWPIIDDTSFDLALQEVFQLRLFDADSQVEAVAGPTNEPAADAGHNERQSLNADHAVGPASDAGHVVGPASDSGHAVGPASDSDLLLEDEAPAQTPEERLLDRLRSIPAFPDDLIGSYGADAIEVIRCLSTLEFNGQVMRLLDGRYAAVETDNGDRLWQKDRLRSSEPA